MDAAEDGFLIGGLLGEPAEELGRRVNACIAAAGFADVRPAHAAVFRHLPPEGGRVTDLATRAGTSKQAMAYLIEHLIDKGYLRREPDPSDGRAQIVKRTERGWEVNRAARRAVMEVQAEWAEALGRDRMELLLALLRDLVRYLGVEYPGSISEVSTRATAS